jgi:hypothetical protein
MHTNESFALLRIPWVQTLWRLDPYKAQIGIRVRSQVIINAFAVMRMGEGADLMVLRQLPCPVPGVGRLRALAWAAGMTDEENLHPCAP